MYKAFMSYSQAADRKFAPALQSALHRFAKPWYRLRAIHVFRDKTSLSVNPALWPSIEKALSESEYFILMASPEAAASDWVKREVGYWLRNRSTDKILIVLTEGELVWDSATGDFDSTRTTAMPLNLQNAFADEPLYLDLRWARTEGHLSLSNPGFRESIAELAAPLHGRSKDEIIGEDMRQHRRTKRLVWSAVIALLMLTLSSIVAAYIAVQQKNIAVSRELAASAISQLQVDPERSVLLAVEAARVKRTTEAEEALRWSLAGSHVRSVMRGHTGKVNDAAFSPDGKFIVTASEDKTAKVWEASTGKNIATLKGHTEQVTSAAFTRNGKFVVAASPGNPTRLWEVSTGMTVPVSEEYKHFPRPVSSPDGRFYLSSSSRSNWVPVCETKTGKTLANLRAEGRIYSASFSPDGRFLLMVIGYLDVQGVRTPNYAYVWRTDTWDRMVPPGQQSDVTSATFSPDGNLAVAASDNGIAILWDTNKWEDKWEHKAILSGHIGRMQSATFSPDSQLIVTAGNDSLARVWEASTGRCLVTLGGHEGIVSNAMFSPDGAFIVTAGEDFTARVWAVREGEKTVELQGSSPAFSTDGKCVLTDGRLAMVYDCDTWKRIGRFRTSANSIAFSPCGRWLVTGTGKNTSASAQVWSTNTWEPTATLSRSSKDLQSELSATPKRGHRERVTSAAFSPDSKYVVTVSEDKTARVWETTTGKVITELRGHRNDLRYTAFSPDGKFIITVDDFNPDIWEAGTWKRIAKLPYGHWQLGWYGASFDPDGKWVVTAPRSSSATVCEVSTGRVQAELQGHTSLISCAAFSPMGDQIATASWDKTARMWEARTGKCTVVLRGHQDHVESIAFSPNGRFVVTAGNDRTVRVWEAETGRSLAVLRGCTRPALFSPDGKSILASGAGGIGVYTFQICGSMEDLLVLASKRVTRKLTSEERKEYLYEP